MFLRWNWIGLEPRSYLYLRGLCLYLFSSKHCDSQQPFVIFPEPQRPPGGDRLKASQAAFCNFFLPFCLFGPKESHFSVNLTTEEWSQAFSLAKGSVGFGEVEVEVVLRVDGLHLKPSKGLSWAAALRGSLNLRLSSIAASSVSSSVPPSFPLFLFQSPRAATT